AWRAPARDESRLERELGAGADRENLDGARPGGGLVLVGRSPQHRERAAVDRDGVLRLDQLPGGAGRVAGVHHEVAGRRDHDEVRPVVLADGILLVRALHWSQRTAVGESRTAVCECQSPAARGVPPAMLLTVPDLANEFSWSRTRDNVF